MILPIIVVVAIVALLLMVHFAKDHHAAINIDQVTLHLRSVDVNAFRNLINENEDEYLRRNLPSAEFRKIQRERRLAAIEYVRCAARNAAILVRVAETARLDPDPAVAQAGARLLENAMRLRIYAFRMIPRLYYAALFPGATLTSSRLPEAYDTVTRQTVMLGCVQPASQGVSAEL